MSKKIKGNDLLQKIEDNVIANYELIKKCGYYLNDDDGKEVPNIEEFFDEHTKALNNASNNGKEVPFYDFPSKEIIGSLPKGKYLFGDLFKCLSKADPSFLKKVKQFKNPPEGDEFVVLYISDLINYQEKEVDEKFYFDIDQETSEYNQEFGFLESTNGSKFLYLFIGIDESEYEDNKGGYYFQQSMSLGCVQIPKSLNNTNSEIQSYELKEDFLCTYYSSYEILQLGNLYIFST